MPYTGVCKWFNQIKGHGVIVHEDLSDSKLNGTEIVCGDKGYVGNPPKHGDRLFYELEWEQERSRFIAVKVTSLDSSSSQLSTEEKREQMRLKRQEIKRKMEEAKRRAAEAEATMQKLRLNLLRENEKL